MGKKEYLACLISLVMLGLTACSDNANKTGSEVSSGTSSAEEKDYGYGFDKFGFSRFDVFPVDTWIKKAFESEYEGVTPEKMSDLLIHKYKENSGFVQQWAFYYKRAKKV